MSQSRRLSNVHVASDFTDSTNSLFRLHDRPTPLRRSGWLLKQSDVLRSWRRRYFVLIGASLSYYRQPEEDVRSEYQLRGCRVRVVRPPASGTVPNPQSYANRFDLVWDDGVEMRLRASTAEEMTGWIDAIAAAVEVEEDESQRRQSDLDDEFVRALFKAELGPGPAIASPDFPVR